MVNRNDLQYGTRVWVPHDEYVWQSGVVASSGSDDDGGAIEVTLDKGGVVSLLLVDPKNRKICIHPRNPDILEGSDDLTSLSYLHEPAVVNNLCLRFSMDSIYTNCGIVLVAINPFKQLSLYSLDIIQAYHEASAGELEPHVFAVAEQAYCQLQMKCENQSVIVSGESGAGKTVSAKYVMRYFAVVAGGDVLGSPVEKRVLASNPIMEAFGNAKTTRNDNSSRFGKYISIDFDASNRVIGASVRTYLLEKTRVVFQADDERSYHIFYQLCARSYTSDAPELAGLHLSSSEEFHYINQGGCSFVDGVDDACEFEETQAAMTLVGIGDEQQRAIFRILAAILHLGNVDIQNQGRRGANEAKIDDTDISLGYMTNLLQLDATLIRKWICSRQITTSKEIFVKPLTVEQATGWRDALAKHIYACVFGWLVSQINLSLSHSSKGIKFIGVLDIYGFEMFETNSFEQFCINYANEKLQQMFNQHIFKLEQEEYVKEKIDWSFIDFEDNQPCLDLIEDRLGILSLLDEECNMPRGSDQTFVQKLYTTLENRHHFRKPRLSQSAFSIRHYANVVAYESVDFLEKNKDTISEELLQCLCKSKMDFISSLFNRNDSKTKKETLGPKHGSRKNSINSSVSSKSSSKKITVGSQFKDSLNLLVDTINNTTPHFIRCIKPNQTKAPDEFDATNVVEQLRACGVLETVRISAAGYPSRWLYTEFMERYRLLVPSLNRIVNDTREACEVILTSVIPEKDKYQFGLSKIFFRAGQVAHLERLRANTLLRSTIMIQKSARMFLYRRRYLRMRHAAILIQAAVRRCLACLFVTRLRTERAVLLCQTRLRGAHVRRIFLKIRGAVIILQSAIRGMYARRDASCRRRYRAAILIQRVFRTWSARKAYLHTIKCIITVQCCIRRRNAKKKYRILRAEARSVGAIKKLNYGLENKILQLANQLKSEHDLVVALTKRIHSLEEEKASLISERDIAINDVIAAQALSKEKSDAANAAIATSECLQLALDTQSSSIVSKLREEVDVANCQRCELIQELNEIKEENERLNAQHNAIESTENAKKQVTTKCEEPLKDSTNLNSIQVSCGPGAVSGVIFDPDACAPNEDSKNMKIVNEKLKRRVLKLESLLKKEQSKISGGADMDVVMQSEVERLTCENLALMEEMERLDNQNAALKRRLSSGNDKNSSGFKRVHRTSSITKRGRSGSNASDSSVTKDAEPADRDIWNNDSSEADTCLGMFSFNEKDEKLIIETLIVKLRPIHLQNQLPGIIGHVIFMCIRGLDFSGDASRLQNLLMQSIAQLKHIVMKNGEDESIMSMWLCNGVRLLSNMKQYSGDDTYRSLNTPEQNKHCIQLFDIHEFRALLNDVIVTIYHALVKNVQARLSHIIVPALLEHEAIPGMSSISLASKKSSRSETAESVVAVLEDVHGHLKGHFVEPSIIRQLFRQFINHIGSVMLNNLLLRKDLCSWSKGVQIRYNLAVIEQWYRDSQYADLIPGLAGITQAAQLLQMRKLTVDDVDMIRETCTMVNPLQIQKLLTLYTPDDTEGRIPINIIRAVSRVDRSTADIPLMLDLKKVLPLTIPYEPSSIKFTSVSLPTTIDISHLLTKI